MADSYFDLPPDEAVRVLKGASEASGLAELLLEKDIWSVWCLQMLFNASFGKFLVFKGGTSLSKAYGLIQRFSEDVDIACDIRHFFPELEIDDYDHLPRSISQADKLAKAASDRNASSVENNRFGLYIAGKRGRLANVHWRIRILRLARCAANGFQESSLALICFIAGRQGIT